jgi:hypothetical protein
MAHARSIERLISDASTNTSTEKQAVGGLLFDLPSNHGHTKWYNMFCTNQAMRSAEQVKQ